MRRDLALSVYDEVLRVACQSRSWFVFMQGKNLCSQGNLLPFRCELEHFNLYGKARLTVKSPVAQFISVKWIPEMMIVLRRGHPLFPFQPELQSTFLYTVASSVNDHYKSSHFGWSLTAGDRL